MKHPKTKIAVVALAAAVAAVGLGPVLRDNAGPSLAYAAPLVEPDTIADVTARVLPSVVSVTTTRAVTGYQQGFNPFFGQPNRKQFGHGLGSGVIVDRRGYILTNNHVIEKADEIKVVLHDGRELKATLVGTDPKADVAVLKLKGKVGKLRPLPFGSSNNLRLGEIVLAVGNPMGVGKSVTMGIVSAKGRGNMGIVDYEDFIQTDAAINPGNSGGALINLKGQLVGIPTAIVSRSGGNQGIGFAIPADMARPIMDSLIKSGRVARGYLGVGIQDVSEDLAAALSLTTREGVLITDVKDGAPAKTAGLKRGDVVVRVDGHKTKNAAALRNRIAVAGPEKIVTLEVLRGGTRLPIPVKLMELPDERGQMVGKATGSATGLGVRVVGLSRSARQSFKLPDQLSYGVVVTEVDPRGKGADIGLAKGDVILEVNRTRVTSPADFKSAYKRSKRRLALLIYRDGMTTYIVITK